MIFLLKEKSYLKIDINQMLVPNSCREQSSGLRYLEYFIAHKSI